jgi:hypothetical protein
MIVKGKTSSGFKYEVNSGITFDAKFVRAMVKIKKAEADPYERAAGAYEMIDAVFSNDDKQIEKLYKHLAKRSDTGRTDIYTLISEVNEIVAAIQEADERAKK